MNDSRPLICNRLARWLLLHRQGLSPFVRVQSVSENSPPLGPGDAAQTGRGARAQQKRTALLQLIEQLGFVQIDSIRTVERAHHMILFARDRKYRPNQLATLLEQDRTLFENWTHDASIIPTRFYPYWRHRFNRERERLVQRWEKHRPQGIADIDTVLSNVRDHGEVRARDMAPSKPAPSKTAPKTANGWWDWHPSKAALEYLWRTGELAVARREGFQKVYDLTDRVIPAQFHADDRGNDTDQVVDWAANAALDRLGLATSGELAAFFELISPTHAKSWAQQQLNAAAKLTNGDAIIEVDVQSADGSRPRPTLIRENTLEELSQLQPPPKRMRVLSPFDPVLRDRKRLQRLFGFEYRIEIFVPAAQRRYGYYVFPLLEGDRLVGRIDMQCDRAADQLSVKALWWEAGTRSSKARQQRLQAELDRQRRFTGMARVVFENGYQRSETP